MPGAIANCSYTNWCVAQCERSGGLEQWVRHYLVDRTNCPNFTIGALEEEEARRIAREICAAEATA
jgi:hypothetical protein